MNKTRFLPALGLFSLLLFSTAHADTKIDPAQAAALYQQAFDSLKFDLSEQEQKILHGEQSGKMSDETRARIREGLQTLSRAASAHTVDWPEKENLNIFARFSSLQNIGDTRNAARMGAWYIKDIGDKNPSGSLEVLQDLLTLSHHVEDEGTSIDLLTSVALENIAFAAIQDRAGQWEKSERERLIEIIQTYAPKQSIRKTMAHEAKYMLAGMRRALFSLPVAASLSDQLRISSVVILSDETWIGLEHLRLGLNFRLEPGQTRHGIELVTFNSKEDFAIVRSEGEEAIIHLQDRKITPIYPKNLFQTIGLQIEENAAQQLLKDHQQMEEALYDFLPLRKPLIGNESNAEIALMMLKEMEAAYTLLDDLLAKPFGELPTDRNPEAHLELPESASAFAAQLASTSVKIRRAEQAAQTNREMAITALRLLDNPETPIPLDPFSPEGEPLQLSIENNTLELRSRHQRGNNRPHTFRLQTK